jgi:heme A synthase
VPGDSHRLVDLLAATAVGVYVLIAAGATTAITDAAAACRSWPACGTGPLTPALAIVWGHRLAALVVGAMVLVTAALAWRRDARPRVRYALVIALALYPIQVGIGAVAAIAPAGPVSALHLGVGVAIFTTVMAALAWTLEPDEGSVSADDGSTLWAVLKWLVKWGLIVGVTCAVLGGASVAGIFYYYGHDLPEIMTRGDYNPKEISRVYSKGGKLIGEFHQPAGRRTVVPLEEIPKEVQFAFMAAEDAGFMDHEGIDYLGMVRAFYYAIFHGERIKGRRRSPSRWSKT